MFKVLKATTWRIPASEISIGETRSVASKIIGPTRTTEGPPEHAKEDADARDTAPRIKVVN